MMLLVVRLINQVRRLSDGADVHLELRRMGLRFQPRT